MFNALQTMLYYEGHNQKFIPSQYGFDFTIPEIEHCREGVVNAAEAKKPQPWVADLRRSSPHHL